MSLRGTSRILLVEDHLINQRVALSQLRKLGYEADLAPNGGAALEALARAPYDAVLMDCQMPDMDGYEATARIRCVEAGIRHTIIIAMTSHAMADDRQKCLVAGMLAAETAAPSAAREGGEPLDSAVIRELRSLGGELFEELVALFIEDAAQKLAALKPAGASGDAQAAERIAHALKGSSGAIGANRMQALCAALQEAAAGGQDRTIRALTAEIETEFASVRLTLENEAAARRPAS
jgi:two-component system, sensor histidine kinase and response regulator